MRETIFGQAVLSLLIKSYGSKRKAEHETEEYRQVANYSQESIQNSRFANNCQEVG